jgi:hypothetical protein
MVDSPMQLDDSKDRDSSEANRLSPDQPPPAPPLPSLSMLRRLPVPGSIASGGAAGRQAASESEKSSENATDASSSDKAESVTNDEGAAGEGGSEDHMCVCTPTVQRVPRPANCEFQCALPYCHPPAFCFFLLGLFPYPSLVCAIKCLLSTHSFWVHHGCQPCSLCGLHT